MKIRRFLPQLFVDLEISESVLLCLVVVVVKHKEFVRSNNLQVKIEITWEFGHSAHEHIELNT